MKTSHALQASFVRYFFCLLLIVIIGACMASCAPQYGCKAQQRMTGIIPYKR
jgi:hypothetical protein